jgi:hypothetical protein
LTFTFQDPATQASWVAFAEPSYKALKAIRARMPKTPNPKRDEMEALIAYLMDMDFEVAEVLSKFEAFYDMAKAEAMMDGWERNPKTGTTIIKEVAEGQIADVMQKMAYAKYVWACLERSLMGSQSLLRKMP